MDDSGDRRFRLTGTYTTRCGGALVGAAWRQCRRGDRQEHGQSRRPARRPLAAVQLPNTKWPPLRVYGRRSRLRNEGSSGTGKGIATKGTKITKGISTFVIFVPFCGYSLSRPPISTCIQVRTISIQVIADEINRLAQAILQRHTRLPRHRLPRQRGVRHEALDFAALRTFAFAVNLHLWRAAGQGGHELHQLANTDLPARSDVDRFADGGRRRCGHDEAINGIAHVVKVTRWIQIA